MQAEVWECLSNFIYVMQRCGNVYQWYIKTFWQQANTCFSGRWLDPQIFGPSRSKSLFRKLRTFQSRFAVLHFLAFWHASKKSDMSSYYPVPAPPYRWWHMGIYDFDLSKSPWESVNQSSKFKLFSEIRVQDDCLLGHIINTIVCPSFMYVLICWIHSQNGDWFHSSLNEIPTF